MEPSQAMAEVITPEKEATAPPTQFPRFQDLPLELRAKIWRICLPSRVISSQEFTIAGELCFYYDLPVNILELDMLRRVRDPPPLISQVCQEARKEVLFGDHACMRTSWCIPETAECIAAHGDCYIYPNNSWFDKKRDTILVELDDEAPHPSQPNEILDMAQDPSIPLAIHEAIFEIISHDCDTVTTFLYHKCLKQRDVLDVVCARVALLLTREGRQIAIDSGRFGIFGESSMVITVEEMAKEGQFISSLLEYQYDMREDGIFAGMSAERQEAFQDVTWINPHVLDIKRSLAVGICMKEEDGLKWQVECHRSLGENLVGEDGVLKEDHWLVKKLELKLPIFRGVTTVSLLPELRTLVRDI